jgi:hypothetical protein
MTKLIEKDVKFK